MTVSYSSKLANRGYFAFFRLLFIWRGSVYRLIWFETLLYLLVYTFISVIYRCVLDNELRQWFESLSLGCNYYAEKIPVAFVLGFYVSAVVGRWWEQFQWLPWPDQLAIYLTAYCHGNSERPTRIRRTIMRYVNLAYCLCLRAISSRARLRFPTHQHMVESGLMTAEELEIYESVEPSDYTLYHVPIVWATNMVAGARKEGFILNDRAVEVLTDELTNFRGKLGGVFGYDWINLPLVYTQVATITVYTYFLTSLFGWQYLDVSKGYAGSTIDIYVPVFGLLRFFFYIGWLKVAESLINPFGEDVDDFEIEYLLERNLNVSYLIVDGMHHEHPDLVRDAFWFNENTSSLGGGESTIGDDHRSIVSNDQIGFRAGGGGAAGYHEKFLGSLANLDVGTSGGGGWQAATAPILSAIRHRNAANAAPRENQS